MQRKHIPKTPLAVLVLIAFCLACIFLPPCYNKDSFLAAIIDKHSALDRARSPKIVFVGGSNLAYGLDSSVVRKELGMDVVNMGLSRMFGLRYLLAEVDDSLKPGDIVVISPEYELLYGCNLDGSTYLMNVPLLFPRSAQWIWKADCGSADTMGALAQNGLSVLGYKWMCWRNDLAQLLQGHRSFNWNLKNPYEPAYVARSAFTADGDFIGHVNLESATVRYLHLDNRCLGAPSDTAIRLLNQFAAAADKRGIACVMVPPPVPIRVYRKYRNVFAALDQYLQTNLTMPHIASTERYALPERDFFNSLYHLDARGRSERTQMVIDDLRAYFSVAGKSAHAAL